MAITLDATTRTFYLDGKNLSYVFYINPIGYPEHLYFGPQIPHDDLRYIRFSGAQSTLASPPGLDHLPEDLNAYQRFKPELCFFGTGDYREPCVLPENAAGDRLTELLYDGYEILPAKPKISGMPSMDGGETLVLHLKDKVNGFAADLYYTVYDDTAVVARRIVYKNGGRSDVTLRRAYSFSLPLPDHDYDAITLYGAWASERHVDRVPLHHGVHMIDSKRTTSSATLNPFLALAERNADETIGRVYGFNLVYSSSYTLKAEGLTDGDTMVTGGINDFDFSWRLVPGEELETPEVVIAFSDTGLGGMSRAYHDAYREHLINRRQVKNVRPLLINNWEGTYFNFDLDKLKAMVDAVQDTGIDTFVLDDGWFGKRDNDLSGLGDWVVNTKKLKGGLTPLIDYVHSKGMRFGLWFEPEMICEDSDLYRAHPEYAVTAPDRPHCYSRHQFMMDLTKPEVCDYIVEAVNRVLHENQIEYVKWDYNRNMTEYFTPGRDPSRQSEFDHRYALGLYDICERIVEANPDVFFEGCSGGGARFDPAMLHYFAQIWTSDDTDAEERTHIQYGTSLVYPLSAMSCHVSVCPNHQTHRTTPFDTRAHIAHLGATGYELDTTRLTAEERRQIAVQTAEYRACQRLVLEGDLYRIQDPNTTNFFSEMIVSKDRSEAILLCYCRLAHPNDEIHHIRLAGLDPDRRYYVRELNAALSGATLMRVGLIPAYPYCDFSTVKYHLTAQ